MVFVLRGFGWFSRIKVRRFSFMIGSLRWLGAEGELQRWNDKGRGRR